MAKYAVSTGSGRPPARGRWSSTTRGKVVAVSQKEHEQIYPKPGWVEHDSEGDLGALLRRCSTRRWRRPGPPGRHRRAGHHQPARDHGGVGPQHRRAGATTRSSGRTRGPTSSSMSCRPTAVRTGSGRRSGLPLGDLLLGAEGPLDPRQRRRRPGEGRGRRSGVRQHGHLVIWNLTGGTNGGLHITDVTNASRTMLMDLDDPRLGRRRSLDDRRADVDAARDPRLERGLRRGQGRQARPASRSPATSATSRRRRSARPASTSARPRTPTAPATSCCSTPARGPCSRRPACSPRVGYKIGDQPAVYCLEGSIAITGALVQWLRDNLKMIKAAPRGRGAGQVGRRQRRPVHRAGVLGPVRAVLEVRRPRRVRRPDAVRQRRPHRPRDARGDRVPDPRGRRRDGRRLGRRRWTSLKVDGGMVDNDTADAVPGRHPRRAGDPPEVAETTALGAAYAAGLAVGFWDTEEEVRENWAEDKRWEPQDGRRPSATRTTSTGRRPSPGPSTGSTDAGGCSRRMPRAVSGPPSALPSTARQR